MSETSNKMMDETVQILANELIARETYRMEIQCEMSKILKPGQFVNVELEGYTLRRPISVSSYDPEKSLLVLLYKVLGEGTAKMALMKPGDTLKILGPLGNGFPIEEGESALLLGGGAGVGPLIQTAKALSKTMKTVTVALGFPTKEEVYGLEAFEELGIKPWISTDDGTMGFHGNVLQLVEAEKLNGQVVYACGPKRMLKGVEENFERGYISLDVRMACGMGACMACVCKDKKEEGRYHRVCKEGPVFPIGSVVY